MSLTLLAAFAVFHFLPHGTEVLLLKPLATLPHEFDQWQGTDAAFEEQVVKSLAVDEYLNRVYQGKDGEAIYLYIGYYARQRVGVTIHSPKNCLPGGGWQPISSNVVWFKGPGGQPVVANLYVIQKGLDRQLALYWYQSHGRTIASEYWAKIDMVVDAIHLQRTDSALVRINTPITGNGGEARDRAVAFAGAILGQLDAVIPK